MVLSMKRWKGKVAVVTGAGSGIGATTAEELVKHGLQVVGVDIHVKLVEDLAAKLQEHDGQLCALKADITNEEDVLKVFKWVSDHLGPVHILVNAAGVIQPTNLTDGDTSKWKKTLYTNVLASCVTTREAVKIMKTHKIDGHIVHINSIVGHTIPNIPEINVYPASKHAITALTETLRQELNSLQLKIKITSVSPGLVDTKIFQNNNFMEDSELLEGLKTTPLLKPEDIADGIVFALSTPPHVQVHELTLKAIGETI